MTLWVYLPRSKSSQVFGIFSRRITTFSSPIKLSTISLEPKPSPVGGSPHALPLLQPATQSRYTHSTLETHIAKVLMNDPGDYPAWDGIYRAPEISPSPISPLAMRFIGECLVTCTTGYGLCQQANNFFPTRLLFLDGKDPNLIQLIEPKRGSRGQYVALSYCWGKGASPTATKDTLPSLKSGFALAELSQTIQDAIAVGRKLRINHIWVDALCIIQATRTGKKNPPAWRSWTRTHSSR